VKEEALIAKQALQIATLEERLNDSDARLDAIHQMLVCIGGPLNDNVLRFNLGQMALLRRIDEQASRDS
jgi:hypothetical protein